VIGTETAGAARALVHREGSLRLYRYAPSDRVDRAARAATPPVVLVYSFINKPTVLDLLPDRSVVRSLLDAGHDVFLVDWGSPGALEAELDLDGHVARLARACRQAARLAGSEQVSVLGYCLGGTMSLLLGLAEPSLIARIALLATPVVFAKGGTLAAWAHSNAVSPSKLALTAAGNVPGQILREMFRWLDPVGQGKKWLTVAENFSDERFMESFLACEKWANSCVDFPGLLYEELLVNLYQQDRLAKGEIELRGEKVALRALSMPILNMVATGDTIVPEDASLPLADLVGGGVVETLEVPGGHIGMTTGRKARTTTHVALAKFFKGEKQS
jgi:polyhydroxyalkanoate synthase subunit PhaC